MLGYRVKRGGKDRIVLISTGIQNQTIGAGETVYIREEKYKQLEAENEKLKAKSNAYREEIKKLSVEVRLRTEDAMSAVKREEAVRQELKELQDEIKEEGELYDNLDCF